MTTPRHEVRSGFPRARAGFSLVEMLLVVVLAMTFAGAAILSLGPLWRNAPLDEGVGRFEGLLRFARAEAAQQGRRVRLHVTPPASGTESQVGGPVCDAPLIQVEWEPEPLSQPGVFVESKATSALAQSLSELVRVESVRHRDPEAPVGSTVFVSDAPAEASGSGAAPGSGMETAAIGSSLEESEPSNPEAYALITFNPDGSSESVEICLAATDPEDPRRMVVQWDGMSGTASHFVARPDAAAGAGADVAGAGPAQPLEPSAVADSTLGQTTP